MTLKMMNILIEIVMKKAYIFENFHGKDIDFSEMRLVMKTQAFLV